MTRRTINLVLIFLLFAIVTGCLWFYYISIQLTSRDTASLVSSVVEKVLGGECQIGKLSVSGLSKLHVSSLVVFRDDGTGELFNISSADIYIAFPESLTGKVEVTRIVLNKPSFELKGQASGGITQILGGAIKEDTSSIQVEVKGGTVRLTPLPDVPEFVLTVGPIDMFLLSPQGKKMPILRGTSSVLGGKFEVFAEYFTAPERVLFKYFLSEFDVAKLEELTKGSVLPFTLIGGKAELKGSYTIAKRGNDSFARITLSDTEIKLKNDLSLKLKGRLLVADDKISLAPDFVVDGGKLGTFSVGGAFSGPEDPLAEFTLDSKNLDLKSLSSLLPQTWVPGVLPQSIEGIGNLSCSIKGSPLSIESYSGAIDLSNSKLSYGDSPVSCDRLTFDGSNFNFQSVSSKIGEGKIKGDISYKGANRELKLSAVGTTLSAELLQKQFLSASSPSFLEGVTFKGPLNGSFRASGIIADTPFIWKDWLGTAAAKGQVLFDHVVVNGEKSLLGDLNGSLHLEEGKLRCYDMSLTQGDYKAEVSGVIEDLFGSSKLRLAIKGHGKGVDGVSIPWLWNTFGDSLPLISKLSKDHGVLFKPQAGEVWLNATVRGTQESPKIFGELKHRGFELALAKISDDSSHSLKFSESRLAFDGKTLWTDSSVVKSAFGNFDYGINVRFPDSGDPVLQCELAPVDDKTVSFLPFLNLYPKPEEAASEDVSSEDVDQEKAAAMKKAGEVKIQKLFSQSTLNGSLKLNGTTVEPELYSNILLSVADGSTVSVKGSVNALSGDSKLDLTLKIGGVKGLSLERVRYLVPGLASSPFAFWMKENGFVKGDIYAKGPAAKSNLSGSLSVETNSQEKWSLVLETDRNKDSLYSLTARCAKGRLERLLPILWEQADATLRPFAIRQPFEGIIRWTHLKDGRTSLAGKMKLRKGAFDLPSPNSAAVEMDVLSGQVSFLSKANADGPHLKTNMELTLKSPLEEVDPEPIVIKLEDAIYSNDKVVFKELSLLLFGEKFTSSGTVDKISTISRFNIDIPKTSYSLARLAKKTLPLNAGISFNGDLSLGASLKGTVKYPEVTGGMSFTKVHLESYYQKGIPMSFDKADVEFSNDNIFFKPFPVKLGVRDAMFPAAGGLKEVLGTSNVWRMIILHPMVAWKKIKDHIGNIDQQQLISKAIGKDEYGKILRSSAHRIKTWIWTETRPDPYVYEAFLTNDEGLAFDNTRKDIVLRYEKIAQTNLASKEGFSAAGFGDGAVKMLRIRRTESSVLDRDGNQIWPKEIPKWRLKSTPGIH